MDDGTIIVGSAHIPKYLDDNVHDIKFENFIEGFYRLLPKDFKNNEAENIYNRKWVMKTYGNDHYYISDLNYLQYLTPNDTKIIKTTNKHNFILKCIAQDSYDCGGTYYTRFKITKISNPTYSEYFNDAIIKSEKFFKYCSVIEVPELGGEKHINEELQKNNEICLKYERKLFDLETKLKDIDEFKEEIKYQETIQKRDEAYQLTLTMQNTIKNLQYQLEQLQYLGIKNVEDQINDITHTYEKIMNDQVFSVNNAPINEVIENDETIYFLKRRKGIFFDSKYWLPFKGINYNIEHVENVDLKNKVVNRIIQLEKIDKNSIKSIISYINREVPDKDMTQYVLPLIAKCLEISLSSEMNINYTLKTNLTKQLNFFKNNDCEIRNSNKDTLFGRILEYLYQQIDSIVDYFSMNTIVPVGNMNPQQFTGGFKDKNFQ